MQMDLNREILGDLINKINSKNISILIGPRQVGKTTLLKLIQKCAEQQALKTYFFDFEDPRVLAEFNKDPKDVFQMLIDLQADVLFFDEFHYVENISKIFKAIYDSPHRQTIFASGSSALEIHKHLKESMAGRKFSYNIYPLSFTEAQSVIEFDDYLIWGGMPAITKTQSDKDRLQVLSEILSSYVNKDIKSLIKEENITAFNHLLKLLAFNQGQIQEISSLATEVRLDTKTLERYLEILEQTFILYKLNSYAKNLSNELKKSKKYYLYDNGIRNLLVSDFEKIKDRQDKGLLYEAYVLNYLRSKILPNMELRFWRTKDQKEIDFVLLKNQKPYLFEVKSHLTKIDFPNHISNFIKHYPETKMAFVINEERESIINLQGVDLHFIRIRDLEENAIIKSILQTVA